MKPTECSMLVPLLSLVLCTVSLDPSQIQVYPEDGGISGVFMAMLKTAAKQYSFNATTAAEVCTSLSVRIATMTEVKMAQRNGLQTCRYGWIKEKLAVIPRVEANEKCGQNNVGVISWPASTSKLFEVFCFNSTEVPTACVIIAVMLILMAAAGAVWYFKIKRAHRLSVWVRIRHKDAVETEMRRHVDQQCSSKKKGKSNSSDDIILQLEEDTE
ncbi:hypothetical protein NFI96_012833 [Prochilodus magdalenae]|nr:hypothetical protein NFI96_012833 [Prochilodus magdalenae]